MSSQNQNNRLEIATFAGGCFWRIQHDFDLLPGVIKTLSGYTGGNLPNPSYEKVCEGTTGHVEALQVEYDPSIISYEKLLITYWHSIDPTQRNGQFCDIGSQYRPIIFYHTEEQHALAIKSKKDLSKIMSPIEVDILPAQPFYPAEEYHQQYYKKSPSHYSNYYTHSGRLKRI